jgi:hypothetical protein
VAAPDPTRGWRRTVDWLFRSRESGEVVVAQAPNLPLIVFGLAWLARRVFDPSGSTDRLLHALAIGALVVWAGGEIVRGVNPWRRFLGVAVLAGQILALA